MQTTVEFVWKKKKLNKPILFTGLPGIGLVGKIAVDYMLKQFKAKKIANVYSDSFPPSVYIENGVLELIRDELLLYRFKNRDFLFLAGPVQPALDVRFSSLRDHYEFAETIVKTAKALGVKEIYTLAGINIGEARMHRNPNVVIAATDKKILEEFKELGAKINVRGGLISGAAGLILGVGKKHGIKGACLMGETSDKLIYGDHGAAKRLLEILVKRYGFKINMQAIAKEARNIDRAFKQIVAELSARREEIPQLEESPTYVR
ncbi:MAG: PAC2 family protein [Candidatus Diapherotrites archaeon]|nr:PAC2 family protein [Candidatus Diapherotrites archaeon]